MTICGIETSKPVEIEARWLTEFSLHKILLTTELGVCKTANFCDQENFLHDEVDKDRIFQNLTTDFFIWELREPKNKTKPYMTTAESLGLRTTAFHNPYLFEDKNNVDPFLMIIHSPFELLTENDQQFVVGGLDQDTFFITPQLNTIDESLFGMKPQE